MTVMTHDVLSPWLAVLSVREKGELFLLSGKQMKDERENG
jgi:hypothetical protein